jgi:polyferredoxin
MVDENYHLPWVVLLFFLIPIIFAFFFGRVFCAGVCPFGALQELVNVKSFRISKPIAKTLSVIPWIYLCFALLFAFTHSRFIICQFDPFIGIFRLGGDTGLIFFGVALLLMSVFTGRPFCRFLCPYGALLSLFSSVSIRKPQITQNQCVNCQLCHQSCPVDAVLPPYQNKVEEERTKSVWRVLRYVVVVPCLMLLGVFLMRLSAPRLSVANKEVRLYQLVMQQEANPDQPMPAEVEAFYAQGRTVEELTATNEKIQKDFLFYGSIAGAVIGWVIGVNLIRLTLRRTRKEYSIDARHCVACGKCFSYCPSTKGVKS